MKVIANSVIHRGWAIMRNNDFTPFFSNQQLEKEFKRTVLKRKRHIAFAKSICVLLVVFAGLLLLSNLWFPVYYITGSSMKPTLEQGMTVVSCRISDLAAHDVVSVQYGDRVLISRLIGMPGDSVQVDEHGFVSVNGIILTEDYLDKRAAGSTDLTFPYHVPDQHYFIMGDNRAESKDSRMSAIGCVNENTLDGKVVFCIWPLHRFGFIR